MEVSNNVRVSYRPCYVIRRKKQKEADAARRAHVIDEQHIRAGSSFGDVYDANNITEWLSSSERETDLAPKHAAVPLPSGDCNRRV